MYRNIYHVRWVVNTQDPVARQSVVTLYLKDQIVQMEVIMFEDSNKMSIGSEINAAILFGDDPHELTFKERVSIVNEIMRKLFIIHVNSTYHIKVEND